LEIIDIEKAKQYSNSLESMPEEQKIELQKQADKQYNNDHQIFLEAYKKEKCSICNKDFKTYSKSNPCLHWLLRKGKFKKKDYPLLTGKFDYHQINMYLRWVANAEYFQKNINDMKEEQSEKKLFQSTIKWKNIEWSFSCSITDFEGHDGIHNYPHYHFQMTIDKRVFINYNGFHNKFSQKDLSYLYAIYNDGYTPSYGLHGSGMQDAMQQNPKDLIDSFYIPEEGEINDGAFHTQSIITSPNGIDMDLFQDSIDESRKTKKSFTKILTDKLEKDTKIVSIISPSERVPEIAKRTEHKRNKQKKVTKDIKNTTS